MRHPHYADFVPDDLDVALVALFGDAALDLDGAGYAALHEDACALAMELAEYDDHPATTGAGDDHDAVTELRRRIGGTDNLAPYVASLLAGRIR